MKSKMKETGMKTVILCFLLLTGTVLFGQESSVEDINPADPAFIEKYEHVDFAGKFAVLVLSNETNNYYMADFTLLPTRFEKVYFLNLVFAGGKIVNIDSDISHKKVWFFSNRVNEKSEILGLFDQLRDKTLKAKATFTDQQKSDWLKKNDKYK